MKTSSAEPPKSDEVEVSIFGPGKGESIVLHLGLGRWIVVDSCIDQENGSILGLEYLSNMGVDLARDVQMIVGTHAHDDHFAGIASLFEACESARFVVSDALTGEEFLALLGADAEIPKPSRYSAYSEYRRIFDIARSRKKAGFSPLKRAAEGTQLLTLPPASNFPAVQVISLSPSEEAKTRALRALAAQSPAINAHRGRVAALDPNDASIALWVEAGDVRILLGADLLVGPQGCGWQAVVATFTPEEQASFYKVAHHGGESSHYQPAWDKLLIKSPVAALAPYRRGRINQPQPSDVSRILSLTSSAYITATGFPTPSRAVKKEASRLGTLAMNVRSVWGKAGHVRARRVVGGGDWVVNTYQPAGPLA